MAPSLGFYQWRWGKEKRGGRGAPVVVAMENPNFSRLPHCFRRVGALRSSQNAVSHGHRVVPGDDKPEKPRRLLKLISGFLVLCLAAALLIELSATGKAGAFISPGCGSMVDALGLSLVAFVPRRLHCAPVQVLSKFCIVLFVVQSADRIILCLGCFWIKLKRIKPRIEEDAIEGDCEFPMVLVQIPMCNEREVYEQSISAACRLDWPKERLLIQVLDDSDDETVRLVIEAEVAKWSLRGVNIVYRHRFVRTGYKAGNLKSAMSCDYVKNYEFVAIFDADFQPNPDFLKLTVPHFKGNPEIGLVQGRWSFVNKDENLLTWLQNINLCFHFEVEQQVNGVFLNFFGFNGTAGVWRIKALEDSGGWLERTTVEDMDIAVRAHLHGWKFVFLNDVKISIWNKANLILLFFLLRKLILPFYSFTLFCVILPLTMFVPEAELPVWVICYLPVFMSFLNILPAPRSFPFIVPYLLFENTMSVTKFNAMVSGLFQLGSSYEWVVTKKAGRSSESDLLAAVEKDSKSLSVVEIQKQVSESEFSELNKFKEQVVKASPPVKKVNKIYKKELCLALLLLTAAVRSLLSAQGIHFYFLLFQGVSFLLVGVDL
uniref:Glycosyltransferase 2-like domain-containing protein n=1 Tax=Ananas comosus var. bracteatus TaxID=296719 RepID=A0A6V7P4L0_ANACO|nr:unnamed protein product [Ananas comosus var. bracteatus]